MFLAHKHEALTNFEIFVERYKEKSYTSLHTFTIITEENLKIRRLRSIVLRKILSELLFTSALSAKWCSVAVESVYPGNYQDNVVRT